MLVLSCDEVSTNPLSATGRQVGIDVGIASFAITSDGTHIDNPRWGGAAADKLAVVQQRLARAKRRSRNRERKRETVAARHRKIANQRKDFHHKHARHLVARYDLLVVEDLQIANMLRRAKPVPDPDQPGAFLSDGARAKSGLSRSISDAGWGRFVSILRAKRKMLGAPGLRSTPGTPPTAAKLVSTQHRRTPSRKRNFVAPHAVMDRLRPTNTPHATSYGLDWPFTRKPREKKPAASSRQRSHKVLPPAGAGSKDPTDQKTGCLQLAARFARCGFGGSREQYTQYQEWRCG